MRAVDAIVLGASHATLCPPRRHTRSSNASFSFPFAPAARTSQPYVSRADIFTWQFLGPQPRGVASSDGGGEERRKTTAKGRLAFNVSEKVMYAFVHGLSTRNTLWRLVSICLGLDNRGRPAHLILSLLAATVGSGRLWQWASAAV